MNVLKCDQGHFYDSDKYRSCPHCGDHTADLTAVAEPGPAEAPEAEGPDIVVQPVQEQIAWKSGPGEKDRDEKTVGLYMRKGKADPVVGWLVCVQGPERGRDYRLHAGRNYVGRSYQMSVCIAEDGQISWENHCSVVYDPMHVNFLLVPGEGTLLYLNGQHLTAAREMTEGDRIGIGASILEFKPFCRKGITWDDVMK